MPLDNSVLNKNNSNKAGLLSIIVPVYNEEDMILIFHQRVSSLLEKIHLYAEILFINDGSIDNSLKIIEEIRQNDPRVGVIDLSRNFGKEIAITAGLDHCIGDAVVVIDADLQDPPELIVEFIDYWLKGYDVVFGQRVKREGESFLKKITAHGFYRVMQYVGRVKIPSDTGDFRLLSRRAVDSLKEMREHHRFMKGLFTWIGYPQIGIPYTRDARFAGTSKWNYWALWNFALEGITSFTAAPLKFSTYLGLFSALGSFIYGSFIITKTIFFGNPVPGYPSLMVAILFLGGIQLMAIGVVGEYLGRMFVETKNRPLYFLKKYNPSLSSKFMQKPSDTQNKNQIVNAK